MLAALAVILVPILIDFRGEDGATITRSNIPERPAGFRVEEIALMPPAVPAPEAPAEPAPAATPAPRADADPAGAAPVASPPEPQGPASASAGAALHGFAVQVGSFSSEENAAAMQNRLRGGGYSAFLDRATVDGRLVYRVLVGPDARREHSERLRDRLAGEMDLRGVVVAFE